MALCALACLPPALAVRGHLWAAAVTIAIVGLLLTVAVQGVAYVLVRCVAYAFDRRKARARPKAIGLGELTE